MMNIGGFNPMMFNTLMGMNPNFMNQQLLNPMNNPNPMFNPMMMPNYNPNIKITNKP